MVSICSSKVVGPILEEIDRKKYLIDSFCTSTIDYMQELRKSSEAKTQPLKKRALLDLLKYFKDIGLTYHQAKINQQQGESAYLMALPVSDQETKNSNLNFIEISKHSSSANDYY